MNTNEYGQQFGNEWTPSGEGQTRYYLNDWHALAGLEASFYGTGNVRAAKLDGRKISNTRARRMVGFKVWIGAEDGEVHVDDFGTREVQFEQRIAKSIESV